MQYTSIYYIAGHEYPRNIVTHSVRLKMKISAFLRSRIFISVINGRYSLFFPIFCTIFLLKSIVLDYLRIVWKISNEWWERAMGIRGEIEDTQDSGPMIHDGICI